MEESSSAEMESMAYHMKEMLKSSEPPLSPECCIYRVPNNIRKLNKEAYTPQVISIGPLHHGDKRLKNMEKIKVRYFKRFVERAELEVEDLVSTIWGREGDVRRCYAETSGLRSDNYVKMILLDASFIIVLFLIFQVVGWQSDDDFTAFMQRLIDDTFRDMCLLENQLPFFVIEELCNHAFASYSGHPSFTQLTIGFFSVYNTQKMCLDPSLKVMHFADLLRTFFLPPSQRLQQINQGKKVVHLYTASQLHEAGVRFEVGSSKCLFDLNFTNGVLKIPCVELFNETESVFRNLVALEQCHYRYDAYVTDYIRLLDFLIDTTKDVDLLVRKKIFVNRFGDSNEVTTFVNGLCKNITVPSTNSNYCVLCEGLNSFYNDRWHRWEATLRRDYLSTPWRIASTVAAIILLVLTLIQTICSIISLL